MIQALNLLGLFCPEVVLKVRLAMDDLPEGTTLVVESSDPLSVIDIPLYARRAGHRLDSQEMLVPGTHFRFTLHKGIKVAE
jgi:tRNA 2-thiouridine synthesizing protein A